MSERDIFDAALAMDDLAERAAYLDRVCGGDAELRNRIEGLLSVDAQVGSFLERPAAAIGATVDDPISEQPGTVIGPYKLMEQIGEGGMGLVFVAEQQQPIRRKVAIKVIKPGMDTRAVIARFEAERQALALMDHPNIAKVLDAGTTDSGRPYFVMELVKGVPITDYCDQNQLATRQRLELYLTVCQAIQHAHQKGIIHRDIKPSNVLVMSHDGTPVVRVIDFGVAKAIGQRLSDKTVYTPFTQMIGTPLYMSPEQAGESSLHVDTRSDIYSLGVLLYELLTGTTPFDKERLGAASYDEIRRIIREEEPSKPSTKLGTAAGLPTLAANRGTEPARLTKLVRGELDWIVMKALDKDRSRRYETAGAFAADVQRYLNDEAVHACPPSASYRLRKFARRNKPGLAVAGLVLLFVALLGGGGGWVARDRAARREEGERRAGVALLEASRLLEEEKWSEALGFVGQAEAILRSSSGGADFLGHADRLRQHVEMAQSLEASRLARATVIDGHFDSQRSEAAYAEAFEKYGLDADGLESPVAADRVRASPISRQLTAALDDWAFVGMRLNTKRWQRRLALARAADPDQWRNRLRDALERQDLRALGEVIESARHDWPPATLVLVGNLAQHSALAEQAAALLRRAQQNNPSDFWINMTLGNAYLDLRRPDEAAHYFGIAVALRPRSTATHANLGSALDGQGKLDEAIAETRKAIEFDPKDYLAHNNLGSIFARQGKLDESIAEWRKAIAINPKHAILHGNLGLALVKQGKLDEAIGESRKAIAINPKLAILHSNLGTALLEQGKLDEAIGEYRKAIDLDPKFASAHSNLGAVLTKQGKLDEAIGECRKAIHLDAKDARHHNNLGNAFFKQGALDEALGEYRQAVKLDPKNAKAHNNFGTALLKQNKLDEALREYRRSIDLYPKFATAHANLGLALVQQGNLHDAIGACRNAIDLDPKDASAHNCVGTAFFEQGKLDDALGEYRKAIDIDPEFADAHFNLGVTFAEQGKLGEAIAEYRKAIDFDPKCTFAHNNLGLAISDQRMLVEAISVFHEAIRLRPDCSEIQEDLRDAIWRLAAFPDRKSRKANRTVELAKKAVELMPRDGTICLALGVAQYRAGDFQAALDNLEKGMSIRKGGDCSDWLFLAMVHWQLGDKAKAKGWYNKADHWMETQSHTNWQRLRAEAAERLGLAKPP